MAYGLGRVRGRVLYGFRVGVAMIVINSASYIIVWGYGTDGLGLPILSLRFSAEHSGALFRNLPEGSANVPIWDDEKHIF